jgi:glycosyltransferase involved in cell wall biosynthesis
MALKIAWAGPWNTHSAIATFGAEVVAALIAEGHRVEVLRTEHGEALALPTLAAPAGMRPLAAVAAARIHMEYDMVIANIGDHFGYHGALVPFLLETDAVVICHDAFMANFCSGWAHQFPDPDHALRAMVTAAYGSDAMPAGTPYWLPLTEMIARRPMLELFTSQAMAAVTHAGHYRARVSRACPGPVATLPLAYQDPGVRTTRRAGDTLEVATFGNVNDNKRITEVIKALGDSEPLRARCRYHVIGAITPEAQQRLETEMRAHGVTNVVFTGRVSDETLRDLLAEMDVICCLRHPILEGGSASVIVAMLSGRTVLVSDQGVYGELPDEVVLKCRPGAEAEDVRRHLEASIADRDAMWARGARARAHAREWHAPGRYARDLLALVERAQADGPALRACARFGRVLGSLGLGEEDPAVTRAAATLRDMLGRDDPPPRGMPPRPVAS